MRIKVGSIITAKSGKLQYRVTELGEYGSGRTIRALALDGSRLSYFRPANVRLVK